MATATTVSLAEIRAGIADNLAAVYLGEPFQISGYPIPEPTPPTLHVIGLVETEYDLTMRRGSDELAILVEGIVFYDVPQHVQIIDNWLVGAYAVKEAIEADKTLGGIVGDVDVRSTGGMQRQFDTVLNHRVLTAVWRVLVKTGG